AGSERVELRHAHVRLVRERLADAVRLRAGERVRLAIRMGHAIEAADAHVRRYGERRQAAQAVDATGVARALGAEQTDDADAAAAAVGRQVDAVLREPALARTHATGRARRHAHAQPGRVDGEQVATLVPGRAVGLGVAELAQLQQRQGRRQAAASDAGE